MRIATVSGKPYGSSPVETSTHAKKRGDKPPVFTTSDSLNVFGPWQTTQLLPVEGKKDQKIALSFRHKVVKKFALPCTFTVEIRNDSDKKIQLHYLAGNNRTNGYAGTVGTINEKVKLGPGEKTRLDYPLPTKNFKATNDAEVCRQCKELDHSFFFGALEAK